MNRNAIKLTGTVFATMIMAVPSLRAQGQCAAPFNFRGSGFVVESDNQMKYRVRLFGFPATCSSVLLTVTNTSLYLPDANIEIPIALDKQGQVTYHTLTPGQSFSIITSDRKFGREPCFLPCTGCDSSCLRGSEVRSTNKEATGAYSVWPLSCGSQ